MVVDNLVEVKNPMVDIRIWNYGLTNSPEFKKRQYQYTQSEDYPKQKIAHGILNYNADDGLGIGLVGFDRFILNKCLQIQHPLKVISFCLYGNEEKYTLGAIKNADIALDIYPDWRCWFYIHQPSVSKEIIERLQEYPNVRIILQEKLIVPIIWKYFPMDDPHVGVMLSRNTDSILSFREKHAVEEWLRSGKRFHVIRDHPDHASASGLISSMIGCRHLEYWTGWEPIIKKYSSRTGECDLDIIIFRNELYPLISKYDDLYVSASFGRVESVCHDMPDEYDPETHFVGEYWHQDGHRQEYYVNRLREFLQYPKEVNQCHRIQLGTILLYNDTSSEDIKNGIAVKEAFESLLKSSPEIISLELDSVVPSSKIVLSSKVVQSEGVLKIILREIPRIPKISRSFIKEMMQILGGCVDFGNENPGFGVFVGSTSLLPLRKSFFIDLLRRFDDNRFIAYCAGSGRSETINEIYNIATQKIWCQVWGESSPIKEQKIIQIITTAWKQHQFISPRQILSKKLGEFRLRTGNLITLDDEYTNYLTLKKEFKMSDDYVDKELSLPKNDNSYISDVYLKKSMDIKNLRIAVCIQIRSKTRTQNDLSLIDHSISFLNECIANYIYFGFDHIFIYNTSNITKEIIKEAILSKFYNKISIHTKLDLEKCVTGYDHCYQTYGKNYDWILNTTSDEVLVFHKNQNAKNFLAQFDPEVVGAIAFHWIFFGLQPRTSNIYQRDLLMGESFLYREGKNNSSHECIIRQIYQPRAVDVPPESSSELIKYSEDDSVKLKTTYERIECNGEFYSDQALSPPENLPELLEIASIYHYVWNQNFVHDTVEKLGSPKLEICTVIHNYYQIHIAPKIRTILEMPAIKKSVTKRNKEIIVV
jgi:hypothetical protein